MGRNVVGIERRLPQYPSFSVFPRWWLVNRRCRGIGITVYTTRVVLCHAGRVRTTDAVANICPWRFRRRGCRHSPRYATRVDMGRSRKLLGGLVRSFIENGGI